MPDSSCGRFHALLVGIDDYGDSSLAGCANDIDDMAAFLTERWDASVLSIHKLVAPAPSHVRQTAGDEPRPTYAAITTALHALATDPVQPGDRVLVYYSGHGSFERSPSAQAYFEGLVPTDHQQTGLLFDFELNRLLQAIAQRSHDLTCILDCCHSAGATRDLAIHSRAGRAGFFPRIDCRRANPHGAKRGCSKSKRGLSCSAHRAHRNILW